VRLYLPNDLPYNACVVLRDNYTARVYEETPVVDSTSNYVDVALDNHYLYRNGLEYFEYQVDIPSCLPSSTISHNWLDRTDAVDIVVIIAILFTFLYFVLSRPIKWLFRGWF